MNSDEFDEDDEDDMPMNDAEYDKIQRRITLITQIETLAINHVKILDLYLAKFKETEEPYWLEESIKRGKEYNVNRKILVDEYVSLGGVNLPKEDLR
jgi:hypothetical protein